MSKIFKFETEEQLTEFDNKYNYSGCFSGEKTVWIYGEGTAKWFSIQFCGNSWHLNYRVNDKFKHFTFYPKNYHQFIEAIEIKIN